MQHRARPLGASLLSILLAGAVEAPAATTRADVDGYLSREMKARSIPGLAWAAVDGDAVVAHGELGLANVEDGAPVTGRSIFAIASLDKQLTAAGVMVLAQRGKLSLDDPLSKWVPGEWGGIRLRHLLAHTSGLPDSVAPLVSGVSLLDYTPESLLANMKSLVPVAPAGDRYLYSDANFVLAQLATEAAAGEPWRDFVRRELFAAAGMEHATFMDPLVVMPGRVAAYRLDAAGKLSRDRRLEVDFGPLYDDLGATAVDFAHWLVALGVDRPLARGSREAMWTPVPLADGRPNDETWQWRSYGLGVGLDRVGGRRVVTHSGHSGVGFVYLPEERRGVVVFTNLEHASGSDPIGLAWGIAGRLWPDLEIGSTPAASDPDPATTAAHRAEYERLLAGKPDLDRWALRSRSGGWDGAASLVGRSRRWGALRSIAFVRAERGEGGETLRFYRADHEKGSVLLRFAVDGEGRIVSVTWFRS